MPNKEGLFCFWSAQTSIGLTGASPAFDGTTTRVVQQLACETLRERRYWARQVVQYTQSTTG